MPELTLFQPATASNAYFKSRNDYLNAMRREEMPDDRPTSLEFSINNARGWAQVESAEIEAWHLWDAERVIAELFLIAQHDENNPNLMSMDLRMLKPYRGRGYTRPLLARVVTFAEKHGRTLVNFQTSSSIPAGEAVAVHFGARRGLDMGMNQLVLDELNKTLLSDWLGLADTKARDFGLGFWGDRFPEGEMDAIIELLEVMNTAPRDDLQEEDRTVKPEVLREVEAYNLARGVERWILYARHTSSGELAGLTETYWYPENPENLEQVTTGVLKKYRGHGLGRWLKAAMLQKVLAERPSVKHIRTENAQSNAPMLAINRELGFKFYKSVVVWQIEVERLKDYLQGS